MIRKKYIDLIDHCIKKAKLLMGSVNHSSLYVYNGYGSSEECSDLFLSALHGVVDSSVHNINFISAEEIKKGKWMSKCHLLAFGGGFDIGFIEALGKDGVAKIRDFVHKGGRYLGMCAGAYFACRHIVFDKGGPLEVVGERHLKFFPGSCVGPLYPGFDYNCKSGVHAVPLLYKGSVSLNVYIEGGGFFQHKANLRSDCVKAMATYQDFSERPTAIVQCDVGAGRAILSGVHLEFPSHLLDKDDPFLCGLMTNFSNNDKNRDAVFRDILKQMDVKLLSQSPTVFS